MKKFIVKLALWYPHKDLEPVWKWIKNWNNEFVLSSHASLFPNEYFLECEVKPPDMIASGVSFSEYEEL